MTFVDDTTVRLDLSDPVHALSYIPYRFGFVPERSLVFLSVRARGPQLQVGLAARINLDDALDARSGRMLIRRILEETKREGARHILIAVFDPEIFTALTADPANAPNPGSNRAAALTHLLGQLFTTSFTRSGSTGDNLENLSPFSIELTYLVGAEDWRCLACRHEEPCPPQGSARTILADSAISAQMVFTGHGIVESREALAGVPAIPRDDQDDAQRAGTAALMKSRRVDPARGRAGMIAEWSRVLVTRPEQHAGISPARAGVLAASLADVQIRDAVLLAMCTATTPAYSTPTELKARLDALFVEGRRPPRGNDHSAALLAYLAGHCRGRLLAPVLATWAWHRWWCGDGTAANVLVDRCLRIDPTHQLARLLNQLLHTNARPPWSEAA